MPRPGRTPSEANQTHLRRTIIKQVHSGGRRGRGQHGPDRFHWDRRHGVDRLYLDQYRVDRFHARAD